MISVGTDRPGEYESMDLTELGRPPAAAELQQHFDEKYRSNGLLGPAPARRNRYGYFTPNDLYETTVNRFITESTHWLDIGAGKSPFPHNPNLAARLSKKAALFVGVDPSENIHENPYVHERFQGMLEEFETNARFDLVTLCMVAEHVEHPDELVSEISRLAKPDAVVVVLTVWSLAPITFVSRSLPFALHHPIKKLFWGGDESDTFPTVYRMNSKRRLAGLFANHGFDRQAISLVGDCSLTGQLGKANHLELAVWKACQTLRIPYPESCLLGVFQRGRA